MTQPFAPVVRRSRPALVLGGVLIAAVGTAISAASIVSFRNTITPRGIVIHHSGATREDGGPLNRDAIAIAHRRRGFRIFYWGRVYYTGYHYIILADGSIEQGRPERCRGAHAIGYNDYIGICVIGDFDSHSNPDGRLGPSRPTEAQMRSLVHLTKELMGRYDIQDGRIVPHGFVKATTVCPGDEFPWFVFKELINGP